MTDTFSRRKRSAIMAAVKDRNTGPELAVRRLVFSMGYRYRLHDSSLPGKPDLVFKRLRKVIFVHGCFWHGHSCGRCRIPATRRDYWNAKIAANASRDRRARRGLRKLGWRSLVVWECQLRKPSLPRRVARFLEDRSPKSVGAANGRRHR